MRLNHFLWLRVLFGGVGFRLRTFLVLVFLWQFFLFHQLKPNMLQSLWSSPSERTS
jgi:hypothetical protein